MATVALIAEGVTESEREAFLREVAAGANRQEAAETIGSTGTRFRSLCVTDADFNAEYLLAIEAGREAYRDRLRTVLKKRATNPEEKSSRFLLAEAATHLPEYQWMKERGRHQAPELTDGLPRPLMEFSRLTTDQLEELDRIWARAEELVAIGQGRAVNPERAEIEAVVVVTETDA